MAEAASRRPQRSPIVRSRLFPHVLFLVVITVVAVVGVTRARSHIRTLTQAATEVTDCATAAAMLDNVLRLHAHCVAAVAGSESEAARQTFTVLIAAVANGRPAAAAIGEDLYWQQMLADLRGIDFDAAQPPHSDRLRAVLAQFHTRWRNVNAAVTDGQQHAAADTVVTVSGILVEAVSVVVLIIVAAVLYLYIVNYRVGRPAVRIATTARAVTAGNLDARAVLPDDDGPMFSLARDVNTMVSILQESLYDEQRVIRELQARTAELEAANRHKNQFLANISHELKTPLSAVIGFADILSTGKHGELGGRQADYIDRITDAAEHLLAMINDLLDIARIDVGEMRLDLAATDVAPLIAAAAAMLSPAVEKQRHALTVHCDADLPTLHLDGQRFRQIVVNLLSNAVKFTPPGGRIEVRCERAGGGVHVSVRDSGIGISPEVQAQIFDDFVQLDQMLNREHEGVGIGLALCRRFVTLFNGTISVDSAPGEGSTFHVQLPGP